MSGDIAIEDPLKIHFNIQPLGIEPSKLQKDLFNHYGLYFNRFNNNSFLINVHISTKKSSLLKLLNFMKITTKQDKQLKPSRFIISYPPGIPICTPSEELDINSKQAIYNNKNSGNLILHIN